MKFECADLDRALAVPELMPELLEHARSCDDCRRALRLWQALSEEAPALRHEWESPELWPRIAADLERERAVRPIRRRHWQWWSLGALAAGLALVALLAPWRTPPPESDLLSEKALSEVERAEGAYVASIERLSKVAEPRLQRQTTPLAAAYQEKLEVLDSAIRDLRVVVKSNPYNTNLRLELASLYREKQRTLQESMQREKAN